MNLVGTGKIPAGLRAQSAAPQSQSVYKPSTEEGPPRLCGEFIK